MPSDRNLLSLNASLAIPTRVLRFEASQRQQSGWSYRPHGRLDRPRWYNRPSWVVEPVWRPHLLVESLTSVLWLNRVTQWFSGEPLQTPQNWCSLRQSPLMARLPRSPSSTLVLRLNQETVHDFICHPCHHAARTCILHTLRPHQWRPFALVLHLHQHQSSRNLHLQYLAKSQSTQRCQSLITQGIDHPPVLEPHMLISHPLDEWIDNPHDL
jgi:hypothetical protein